MRKVEKIKVINVFKPERAIEIEAVIDTGATMLVFPQQKEDLERQVEVLQRFAEKEGLEVLEGITDGKDWRGYTMSMIGKLGKFS